MYSHNFEYGVIFIGRRGSLEYGTGSRLADSLDTENPMFLHTQPVCAPGCQSWGKWLKVSPEKPCEGKMSV